MTTTTRVKYGSVVQMYKKGFGLEFDKEELRIYCEILIDVFG